MKKKSVRLIVLFAAPLLLLSIFLLVLHSVTYGTQIPRFSDYLILELNGNIPEFTLEDFSFIPYTSYSKLDRLGRAGTAMACLNASLLPTEARGSIAELEPTGWKNQQGLYHRSHLIANQLGGDDALENLITGTAFLNVDGMLPYENRIAMYVKNTGNHVLYRVTPLYSGFSAVASAVQMEAYSLEDYGQGICFNLLLYNVQPGYRINYLTGKMREDGRIQAFAESAEPLTVAFPRMVNIEETGEIELPDQAHTAAVTYILNARTKRFHYPYCDSVFEMKLKNRVEFYGSREEALAMGYTPCGACFP